MAPRNGANGCWKKKRARPFIRRALELGINFFDTADMYSVGVSEEILGRALKDFGPSRDRVVIATKVFNPMGDDPNQRGLSRKHIFHAIDDSLRRLQTDYVDLYQIHRFDYQTPIEETLEALHDVVKMGKALYIGASSMFAWQFAQDAVPGGPAAADALRQHAESLQPDLSRRRARDDAAVPRRGHRRDSVESAGARLSGGQSRPGGFRRHDARQDRRLRARDVLPAVGLRGGGPGDARSRASAALPTRRWRWRGCCTSPA